MKKIIIPTLIIIVAFALFLKGESNNEWKDFQKEYEDLIHVDSPQISEELTSPFSVRGEARGYWFFEASFPVILTDWDGRIIAETFATAKGEWMTEEFVPFEAEVDFDLPEYGDYGFLILKKANASGLPEHDDAFEMRVEFKN